MKLNDMVRKYGWEILAILPGIPNVRGEGNIYFVDSGNTTTGLDKADGEHGHSWLKPFVTLNFAISQCTDGQGDVVLMAPGHAETLSTTATESGTTTTEVGVDKAGVHLIGLGTGSLRPTFTSSATAGQIAVLAANVTIENILMVGNVEDLTDQITLDGSSDGAVIRNCEFRDGGVSKEVIANIDVANGCDDVIIEGCRIFCTDANTASVAGIRLAGSSDRTIIRNCYMRGDWSSAAILATATTSVDLLLENNYINNLEATAGLAISMKNTTTGAVVRNLMHGGLNSTHALSQTAMMCCENYMTNDETASGMLSPGIDSL